MNSNLIGVLRKLNLKRTFTGTALALGLLFLSPLYSLGQVLVWGDNSYGQTNVPASATNVIALAAGDDHCLALRADGTVLAWGSDLYGQTNVPPELTNVVAVAAGSTHCVALRKDGTIALWGAVYGSGLKTAPPDATNIVQLALGGGAQHVLVLRSDGTVMDFGGAPPNFPEFSPVTASLANIVEVAASAFGGMALHADGTVVTWGFDFEPVTIPSFLTNVVGIESSWYGFLALRADGTGYAMGSTRIINSKIFTNIIDSAIPFSGFDESSDAPVGVRSDGSLAQTQLTQVLPASTASKGNFVAVAAGGYDGLLLTASGPPVIPGLPVDHRVAAGSIAYMRMKAVGALPLYYQWSCNGTNLTDATNSVLAITNVQLSESSSQYFLTVSNSLGLATNGPINLYVDPSEVYVQASSTAAVVDELVTLTAAVTGQGPLTFQWQFDGTNIDSATSTSLTLTNAQLSDAGSYTFLVSNSFGLVSNVTLLSVVPSIVTISLADELTFLGGAETFSLGLQIQIPVSYQWQFNGSNLDGQTNSALTLTNLQYDQQGTYSIVYSDSYETVTNSATLSIVPVAVWGDTSEQEVPSNLSNVLAIAAGYYHEIALRSDGTVVGWGLGHGATPPNGLSNVVAISAGVGSSLALLGNGTVVNWGDNGILPTNQPVGLSNVVAIADGGYHNLALRSDGTVVAWGSNFAGETNVPPGLSNVVAISANQFTSMALQADGTVVAWGSNTNGESSVPAGVLNAIQISSGVDDSFVLEADGTIVGWGVNSESENTPPAGLSNVVSIASGNSLAAALTADGSIISWGGFPAGSGNMPTGLANVTAIAANQYQLMALIGDGPPVLQAPLSNPQISSNGFTVTLSSQSGHTYALEYKTSLDDTNWIAMPLATGTGRMLILADPQNSDAQRFYRVQRW